MNGYVKSCLGRLLECDEERHGRCGERHHRGSQPGRQGEKWLSSAPWTGGRQDSHWRCRVLREQLCRSMQGGAVQKIWELRRMPCCRLLLQPSQEGWVLHLPGGGPCGHVTWRANHTAETLRDLSNIPIRETRGQRQPVPDYQGQPATAGRG